MINLPVCVIIPTYKDGTSLKRALLSIVRQTCKPEEIIVVDDASNDGNCADLALAFPSLAITVVTLQENSGPGAARNSGIASSSSPYIAFLDADDEWHPEKLSRQMDIMQRGHYAVTAHQKLFSGEGWQALSGETPVERLGRWAILSRNPASISTVIIRRDALRFGFPEWYAGEDYAFVAAHLLGEGRSGKIPLFLARADKKAFGSSGLSARMLAMQIGEIRAHYFLFRTKLVRWWELAALVPWTWVKFARRLLITWLS